MTQEVGLGLELGLGINFCLNIYSYDPISKNLFFELLGQ